MRKGWEIKRLEEVVDIINGRNQSQVISENGEYPIYGSAGNLMGYARDYLCERGSTIIGRKGNISTPIFIEERFWNVDTAFGIYPKDGHDPKFINYLCQTIDFKSRNKGTTIPSLVKSDLLTIDVPFISSLHEQKRIVAILDEAFAAIDKAKANTLKNLQNAKELFESYLQGVFENKGEGWEEKKLIDVTKKIGSGATPLGGEKSYKSNGISLIRSLNVYDNDFRKKDLAFIDEKQASKLNNVTIEEDDVLFNITGASVARCCLVPIEVLPARVNQHVSIVRSKKDIVVPKFIQLSLTARVNKNKLLKVGEQGATRQAITKAQLEEFVIQFPTSLNEQKQTIYKIELALNKTRQIESIYKQKLDDLEELKKSILQKAFSGELTEKTVLV